MKILSTLLLTGCLALAIGCHATQEDDGSGVGVAKVDGDTTAVETAEPKPRMGKPGKSRYTYRFEFSPEIDEGEVLHYDCEVRVWVELMSAGGELSGRNVFEGAFRVPPGKQFKAISKVSESEEAIAIGIEIPTEEGENSKCMVVIKEGDTTVARMESEFVDGEVFSLERSGPWAADGL